jgi:hypothetical protein
LFCGHAPVVKRDKIPVLTAVETRQLVDFINASSLIIV